jgi:hypothetical protein
MSLLLLLRGPTGPPDTFSGSGEITEATDLTGSGFAQSTRRFSFEGGTTGATISTADTPPAGDDAWTATDGSTQTVQYSDAHAAHGALSGKFDKVASGTGPEVRWATGPTDWSAGGAPVAYARAYLYLPTATGRPPAGLGSTQILRLGFLNPLSNYILASIRLRTASGASGGRMDLFGGTGGTSFALNGTVVVPFDTWVRLELRWTAGASNDGSAEARLWTTADSTGPPDDTITATGLNTAPACNALRVGIISSASATRAGGLYLDDVAFSSVDAWIGPAVAPALDGTGTVDATTNLTGSGSKATTGSVSSASTTAGSSTGSSARTGSASMSATSGATSAGVKGAGGVATAGISAGINSGPGTRTSGGTGSIAASSSVTCVSGSTVGGSGSTSAATSCTSSGRRGGRGAASLAVTTGLSASGGYGRVGTGLCAASGSLSGLGTSTRAAPAAATITTGLVSSATTGRVGLAATTVVAAVGSAGVAALNQVAPATGTTSPADTGSTGAASGQTSPTGSGFTSPQALGVTSPVT